MAYKNFATTIIQKPIQFKKKAFKIDKISLKVKTTYTACTRGSSRLLFRITHIIFVNKKGGNCLRIHINNNNFHTLKVLNH